MRKYYATAEFKALNDEWRKKLALKESGFVDQEDARGNLKVHDRRTIASRNAVRISTFFTKLECFIDTHPELPPKQAKILELYAKGRYMTSIAKELGCCRRTVWYTLNKYKKSILELP